MNRSGCLLLLLAQFLLFSPIFSQKDPRCKRKNEVFSECAGCEETCQTKKPYTCVCNYGCKCKEGYKLNENNDECVPKWNCPFTGAGGQRNPAISDSPVVETVFGQPISAIKDVNAQLQVGTKNTGKYFGNLWNQFSKDSGDVISGIYSFSVKRPTHNFFYLINKAMQSSGTWGHKAYRLFFEKPWQSFKEIAQDYGLEMVKYLRTFGEFYRKVYDQVYDSFLRKPTQALGDILNQMWRYTNKFFEYLWNITKALSYEAYTYGIQKPLELAGKLLLALRIVSERITQWLTKNLNAALVKSYDIFVMQPYKMSAKITAKLAQQMKSVYSYLNAATNDVYGKLYDAFLRKPVGNLNDYWEYLKKEVFPQYYKTLVQYPYDATKKALSTTYDQTKSALDKLTDQTKLYFQKSQMQTKEAFKSISEATKKFYQAFNKNFVKDPTKALGSFSRKINHEVADLQDKAQNKVDELVHKNKMKKNQDEMGDINKSLIEDIGEYEKDIFEKPLPVGLGESNPPEGSALVDLIMKSKPEYISEPKKQVQSKYGHVNIGDGLIGVPPIFNTEQLEVDGKVGKIAKEMETKRKEQQEKMLDEQFSKKAKDTFEKDKEMEKSRKQNEDQQIEAAREDLVNSQQGMEEISLVKKLKKKPKLKQDDEKVTILNAKANMDAPIIVKDDRKPQTFPS